MKKHVALTMLLITTLGVLNAHVDLPELDGRRFVQAEGRLHDPLGWLEDRWNGLTRQCRAVQVLAPSAPLHGKVLAALQDFSPPDSRTARLLQLQAAGPWLLAEVVFERLHPAVVVLWQEDDTVQVVERAVWSGSTEPWRPAPRIRRHLLATAPGMPEALVACYTPRVPLFQARSMAATAGAALPGRSVVFLGVVDRVLGNLDHQVLLRKDGLTAQA